VQQELWAAVLSQLTESWRIAGLASPSMVPNTSSSGIGGGGCCSFYAQGKSHLLALGVGDGSITFHEVKARDSMQTEEIARHVPLCSLRDVLTEREEL
jgi:hypothetical protein